MEHAIREKNKKWVEGLGIWRETGEVQVDEIIQIWLNCSRIPKDCPPLHGICSSMWTILREQENMVNKSSGWTSRSIKYKE